MRKTLVAVALVALLSVACNNTKQPGDTAPTAASASVTTSTVGATPTLPTVDANPGWRQLPPPPISGRIWHSTTWSGQLLIIWGGLLPTGVALGDGAMFNPSTEEWQVMSPSPLEPRVGHAATWTGDEIIIWGGRGGSPVRRLADGAAYQPVLDEWRPIATPPLSGGRGYVSVWTGSEMIVLGGNDGHLSFAENGLNEAGAYNPTTDTWRVLEMPVELVVADALWTGEQVVLFGVQHYLGPLVGVSYDPATDAWRELPTAPVDPPVPDIDRIGHEILAWSYDPEEDGIAAFDPTSDSWRDLPPLPGQTSDGTPTAAALGHDQLLMQSEGTIAIYSDAAGSWRRIEPPLANIGFNLPPLWTGSEALFLDPGLPPGDPNAPDGLPAHFWSYRPEEGSQ